MIIKLAEIGNLEQIKFITHETVKAIYPHYYPKGAVDFFLAHHSVENITADINDKCVFIAEHGKITMGTVTVREAEICRLFVIPEYQGRGFGRALLDFAEHLIAGNYRRATLSASLPAKAIYLKRGYKEVGFNSVFTENGDFLCYDTMEKSCLC